MTVTRKTAITGVQPTGRPHLGNYLAAMKPIVDLQEDYETYVSIVNFHALTTVHDKDELKKMTYELVLDYLAIGLDPQKATFFLQSDVPEHIELSWIFSTLVSVPWLQRAHAFKEKSNNGVEASVGLFTYPILMAADILLVGAEIVPVGKDQIQHIEMTREIVRKFNKNYGDYFSEPKEQIKEGIEYVPGTDGRKMSKSYGNTIPLFADDTEIKKSIMGIVTDSKDVHEVKDPDTCNIFTLHKLITKEPELSEIREKYKSGGYGYGDSKKLLLKNYLEFIEPMRKKRKYYEDNKSIVAEIMKHGKEKIRSVVCDRMDIIRKMVGL